MLNKEQANEVEIWLSSRSALARALVPNSVKEKIARDLTSSCSRKSSMLGSSPRDEEDFEKLETRATETYAHGIVADLWPELKKKLASDSSVRNALRETPNSDLELAMVIAESLARQFPKLQPRGSAIAAWLVKNQMLLELNTAPKPSDHQE